MNEPYAMREYTALTCVKCATESQDAIELQSRGPGTHSDLRQFKSTLEIMVKDELRELFGKAKRA